MKTVTVLKTITTFDQVPMGATYYHMGEKAIKVSDTHANTDKGLKKVSPTCFVTLHIIPATYFGEEINVEVHNLYIPG